MRAVPVDVGRVMDQTQPQVAPPLDMGALAVATLRQPPLPQPPSRLTLPLKEHRKPDKLGGGLHCTDGHLVRLPLYPSVTVN